MLRFGVVRFALHGRLFPLRTEAAGRKKFPFERNSLNHVYQRLFFFKTFTSIIESSSDAPDHDHSRKMKKLLEPSLFDSAVTFEEAFGENVISSLDCPSLFNTFKS